MNEQKNELQNNILTVTDRAEQRIVQKRCDENCDTLFLRVTVQAGGCSGFEYVLTMEDLQNQPESKEDRVFKNCVVVDSVSLDLLKDAIIDFEEGLMGADFKIINPNAIAGCGCGQSFDISFEPEDV